MCQQNEQLRAEVIPLYLQGCASFSLLFSCLHRTQRGQYWPPFFCVINALTVDDASRRRCLSVCLFSTAYVKSMVDFVQSAILMPSTKIVVYGAFGRKILWQISPLATSAQDVQQTIYEFTHIRTTLASSWFCRRNKRLY